MKSDLLKAINHESLCFGTGVAHLTARGALDKLQTWKSVSFLSAAPLLDPMPRDTTVIKAATGEWHWMLKMTTAKPWLLRHRLHHLRKIRGIHEKQGLRSPFPVHYTTGFFANSFPLCAWATFASDNVNKMTTNCICFGILFWTLKYPLNFLTA